MKTLLTILSILSPTLALAQLYTETFDDGATAKIKIVAGANTAVVAGVDYSNLTVGATLHNIPEAPGHIAGSAATRGILMQQTYGGTARIINCLLADSLGGTPVTFSGSYRMKFDLFLNCATTTVSGSTENGLWGIGNNDSGRPAYVNRTTTAIGTWGWLSTEGGIGTNGDAGLYSNNSRLASRENLTESSFFQSAFSVSSLPVAYTPAQSWTRVEIVCLADAPPATSALVSVFFNGVKFFEGTSFNTAGHALFGYDDPFTGSNSGQPDSQFALVDNVVVESVDAYSVWASQYFPEGSPDALPGEDPDEDGFENLAEYLFGLNPAFYQPPIPVDTSDPFSNSAGMTPVLEVLTAPNSLRLSFVRRTDDPAMTCFFDVATNPQAWTSLPLDTATLTPLTPGFEFVQMTVPASDFGPAAEVSFFGRLKISRP